MHLVAGMQFHRRPADVGRGAS